jgi:hypothetical protein
MKKYTSFEIFRNKKYANIQLAFCCDATGSMDSYLTEAKDTVLKIQDSIANLKFCNYEFAFVAYRDHCDESSTFLTKYHDFDSKDVISNFINEIDATGGGDTCEAVIDGLSDCADKLSWKNDSIKIVFHIADAPPHGQDVSNDENDHHPDGCPCGQTIGTVAKKFKDKKIKFILMDCSKKDEDPLGAMKCVYRKKKNLGNFPDYKIHVGLGLGMLNVVAKSIEEAFQEGKEDYRNMIRSWLD